MLPRFLLLVSALFLWTGSAAADEFQTWLQEFRAEAEGRGISVTTLDSALNGISPIPRVVELDRKQPEFTLTYTQYRDRVVPLSRIKKGRR